MFASLDLLHGDRRGLKRFAQAASPIPFGAFAAAVEVECRRTVFRVCVAGEVRLGQCDQTGDAGFALEFVPDRIDRAQSEGGDHPFEYRSDQILISK